MVHIEIPKKIKYTLSAAIIFLMIVLVSVFINMRKTISESKKETAVLNMVKNVDAVHLNTEYAERIKEIYLKTGNETYLKKYTEVSNIIKVNKNELLDYSIKNNYKKDTILLLANIAARKITISNTVIDLKKYGGNNERDIFLYDSIGKTQIDSIIVLATELNKNGLNILKATTQERQAVANNQLLLFILLALLFFTSLVLTYFYFKKDFKKKKHLNKLLLYNSTLLQNIYDAIITADNNYIITDWNLHAENLYGYSAKEAKGQSFLLLFKIDHHDTEKLRGPMFVNEVWKGEAIQYHKNGKPIHVEISRTAVKTIDGVKQGCICVVRDITTRVQLENDLKNLTENLQEQVKIKASELNFFFERITDAFIAFDNDWNYTYLNKAALELHRMKEEEILGKNLWEVFPDLINEPFYDALHLAKTTQEPQRCELYYSAADKWYADLIYPSENGITVYYHDVTSKKKAALQLINAQVEITNAEAKFRSLVEQSMVGVYIRREKELLYINPRFSEIFGYTEDELYSDFDVFKLIHESSRSIIEENLKKYSNEAVTTHRYEFAGQHKNGKIIYAEVFGSVTKYKGENAVIGTIIDITERKIADQQLLLSEEALKFSNERYELVAKATKDGIWDWDIENDKLSGNAIFCSMLCLNENEKSNYKHFSERVHPGDKDKLLKNFRTAVSKKETLLMEEFRFMDKEGNYRIIYDRAYILYKENVAYRMLGAMQDITAMKETENKLLLEKELSDSIINSLPGIFYLFNKEGKYLRWNNNFENVSGYTSNEIKKIHPLDLFTSEDKEIISKKINNVFNRGSDIVEANFKCKSGKLIPYYFTGMSIKYEDEDCLLGVGLDISEKIKSQKELFESEQKFRTLVQQASDGIIITDEDGNFIDVNDTAASLTGYKKEELETLNTNDIFFEEGSIKRPMHYNAMANGAVVISEHIIRRKGGKLINVEVSAKQLSDGRFQRILRDITERTLVEDALRASEKKYRLLFNDNPLPMWITTIADNRFIDVNNAALESYGYTKDIFLKMKLSDLDAPEKNRILQAEQIFEHIKKDGSKIKVNIITHDITYEGKPAILSLANDITAKFEAEESLQKSNEALRDLASHLETIREKERSHMAREIHDELGQQLTGLKMDISWINRKIKSDDEAVKEKMKDTIALIDKTVITVRRIATQLRPSILDDLGLIAAMEWQSEEFEKRSEIKSVFNSNVSQVAVSTDIATAVFRIFQESLTNVLRHSKATEVISFFRMDKDIITLFIEDNGIGFKEEEIKNKRTLGLLGMKERIQLINGRYEINGNTGKGTSVIITVPLT